MSFAPERVAGLRDVLPPHAKKIFDQFFDIVETKKTHFGRCKICGLLEAFIAYFGYVSGQHLWRNSRQNINWPYSSVKLAEGLVEQMRERASLKKGDMYYNSKGKMHLVCECGEGFPSRIEGITCPACRRLAATVKEIDRFLKHKKRRKKK